MRLTKLAPEDMTPRQREVYERIGGKRGRFGAPYRIWIRSPELCDRAERLSSYLRWECSLPNKLRELSILITARFWDAQYSWNAHVDQTIAAGISSEAIAAIAAKRQPVFEAEDERVFYRFCSEMLENHFVSDETFEQARRLFGEVGIVDIIACIGNFSMLAMCLNTAQADLPPDRKPPFPDVRGYAKITSPESRAES